MIMVTLLFLPHWLGHRTENLHKFLQSPSHCCKPLKYLVCSSIDFTFVMEIYRVQVDQHTIMSSGTRTISVQMRFSLLPTIYATRK